MASLERLHKQGSLTIAGSGIASIGHITLLTLTYIKESERVYYLVTDPATEAFIIDNAREHCVNLRGLYGKDKNRFTSYVQMSEVMLKDVRAGYSVLGILYGHPGVFVSPTHRAIAIAQDEGFEAQMLPAISADSCMYADLGIDPSTFGCSLYEATELLTRGRRLDPTTHNIIWQVGSTGIINMDFHNNNFHLLVDRLRDDFGPDHRVIHYIGVVLPQSKPTINALSVSDLYREEIMRQFNATSTLYVPPRDPLPINKDILQKLGLGETNGYDGRHFPHMGQPWASPKFTPPPAYGPLEREAIEELDRNGIPEAEKVLRKSPAMREFMTNLALNHKLLRRYLADAPTVVEEAQGLTHIEKFALRRLSAPAVRTVMWASPVDTESGREPTEEEVEASDPDDSPPPESVVVVV
ncbi:hypothetical protein FRC06_008277 [Ceratobasidium sp. 370]|nr:hypothetical protein FRC06_008277 [Ceratobasidium sp. 370]